MTHHVTESAKSLYPPSETLGVYDTTTDPTPEGRGYHLFALCCLGSFVAGAVVGWGFL